MAGYLSVDRALMRSLNQLNDAVRTWQEPEPQREASLSSDVPDDPGVMFQMATGHAPDPWQVRYLNRTDCEPCQRQRNLLLTARQVGKSTVVGVRAARRMLRWRRQEVITVSKTDIQAKQLARKIARNLTLWCPRRDWLADNLHEIELPNGNVLVTLPGGNPDGIRAFSPTLMLLDEAAFVTDELIAALSPMLARTRGDWDMLSSANGPAGTFYQAAEGDQKEDWNRQIVTADQCPFYDKPFLLAERKRLGEARYMREYYCRFMAAEGAYFSLNSIEAMMEGDRWTASVGSNDKRPALDEPFSPEDLHDAYNTTRYADKNKRLERFLDD